MNDETKYTVMEVLESARTLEFRSVFPAEQRAKVVRMLLAYANLLRQHSALVPIEPTEAMLAAAKESA